MRKMQIKNVSSLEKIFPEMECRVSTCNRGSALMGEEYSYQIAFKMQDGMPYAERLGLEVISDIADCVCIHNVRYVPVIVPRYHENCDSGYISDMPGLYPDILEEYLEREGEFDFNSYPEDSDYIIKTREIVNSKIRDYIHN